MNEIMLTIFFIALTISVYVLGRSLFHHAPSPFTMPIFTSTMFIIILLFIMKIPYDDYELAKEIMTFLLGPATVALAVPLYEQRKVIFRYLLPIFLGIFSGTLITILSALFIGMFLNFPQEFLTSLSLKSITIPIASELAPIIQANEKLVMLFVMVTGMTGAMFGNFFLKLGNITDPLARGLSYGTISHGIGTSQALLESDLTGASSSVAMGLSAIITSIILPWFLPLIIF